MCCRFRSRRLKVQKATNLPHQIIQSQLLESVTELQEILDLHVAKQKVTHEIQSKDASILGFAYKLKEVEQVLVILVNDYSDYFRLKRSNVEDIEENSSTATVATRLNLSDILRYAHRVSYTTITLPEFGTGMAPLQGAFSPGLQEEQMCASRLFNFDDFDVGLPRSAESKEKFSEPLAEDPAESNPHADMAIKDMILPTNLPIPPLEFLSLFLLGLRSNSFNLFLILDSQRHLNLYSLQSRNAQTQLTAKDLHVPCGLKTR